MKYIKLTRSEKAIIDDEDFEEISKFKWHFRSDGYAARRKTAKSGHLMMHREINKTPEGMETDHINGNRLDNRRSNLRSVTHSQNQMNRFKTRSSTGSRGITFRKDRKTFMARICINYNIINLGNFKTLEAAKLSRKEAVEKYYGEFANSL